MLRTWIGHGNLIVHLDTGVREADGPRHRVLALPVLPLRQRPGPDPGHGHFSALLIQVKVSVRNLWDIADTASAPPPSGI
jgi:hypothetical protein